MAVDATPAMRATLAAPLGDRVFFAGEATAENNPSTVHGAQASGRRVAAEVLTAAADSERVIIIGAGAAGIAAARTLADAGLDVLVIEARESIGGRVQTVVTSDGLPIELGASWVHDVAGSDLAAQLDEIGVLAAPFDYDLQSVLDRTGARIDEIEAFVEPAEEAIAAAVSWAEELDQDVSLADALQLSGAAQGVDADALDHLDQSAIAAEYGAGTDELSAWWGLEEGSEGDDLIVLGGYDAILRAMAEGLTIELRRPVSQITWSETGVLVVDASGQEATADRVVVTVPLGVLKSGAISFQPPLPLDKVDAIERIGFGLLDKVWFVFDEAFWTESSLVWNVITAPGTPYREWFNFMPVLGKPVLLSLVGGSVAREWSQRSDDDVKAAALSALQLFVDAGW